MSGGADEPYAASYRAATSLEQLGRPYAEVLAAYEACIRSHPHRAEPLVRAAVLARSAGRFSDAHDYARRAAQTPRPAAGAPLIEDAVYDYRAADEQAIAAWYCGLHDESFALCTRILDHAQMSEGERARVEQNRDYSVPYIKDAFLRYDADVVARLARRGPSPAPRVTLSITSCKRLDLFVGTVCSFLKACADIDLVDRFLCVDDNSSAGDRAQMQRLFPFFEFVFKGPDNKGHARSLNMIRDTVRTPWLVHLEDDWHFFARRAYIGPAIEILEEDSALGQVLFNRNYAETLPDRELPGGFRRRTERGAVRHVVHEHYPAGSEAHRRFQANHGRPSNAWWPHYSLRPSLLRTAVLGRVGTFDEGAAHFELDYATRYADAGYLSGFFDGVFALHTGRLTSERGNPERRNAYDLNREAQFGALRTPGGEEAPGAKPGTT